MATTAVKGKEAVQKEEPTGLPKIVELDEMPRSRRGRSSADLTELENLVKDLKPHAILDIDSRETSEKWARKIRAAAKNVDLEVSTSFQEAKQQLAFQGFPEGEAPARGRRSAATRKNSDKK